MLGLSHLKQLKNPSQERKCADWNDWKVRGLRQAAKTGSRKWILLHFTWIYHKSNSFPCPWTAHCLTFSFNLSVFLIRHLTPSIYPLLLTLTLLLKFQLILQTIIKDAEKGKAQHSTPLKVRAVFLYINQRLMHQINTLDITTCSFVKVSKREKPYDAK